MAADGVAATAPPAHRADVGRAAAWMAGWLSAMTLMAVAGREASRSLHVFQIMEMRSLIGIVLFAPLVIAAGGLRAMRSARLGIQVGRNAVHFTAQFGWLYAITLIPIGQVVAIEFTMPIWTAVLAVVFLGERMTPWKVAAIALGLAGVWLIVRPHPGAAVHGQLIALAAAVGFAISVIMVKSLTGTDGVVRIIFWMLVIQSAIGLVPAVLVWRTPPTAVWPWILVIAVCGTFSHYCMARAMRHADATVVVPMDFLRVPLTALAGALLYAEGIDALSVVGAALVLGGNLLNLRGGRAPAPRATGAS